MFKKFILLSLFFLVVTPVIAKTVVIPVKIVADYTFTWTRFPWQIYAKKVVGMASARFEKELDVKFQIVEIAEIKIKSALSTHAELDYVAQTVAPPENGIVIWLSSRTYDNPPLYRGCALFGGHHCMVTDEMETGENCVDVKTLSRMLVHELLHLLGVDHSNDKNSIMAPSITTTTPVFDRNTLQVVLAKLQPEKK